MLLLLSRNSTDFTDLEQALGITGCTASKSGGRQSVVLGEACSELQGRSFLFMG